MKNETEIPQHIKNVACTMIADYHQSFRDLNGFSNIVEKLVNAGAVITTGTWNDLMGAGCVGNFVGDTPYEGGVDLYEWTLKESFWVSKFFEEYLKLQTKELMDEISVKETELEKMQNNLLTLKNFMS